MPNDALLLAGPSRIAALLPPVAGGILIERPCSRTLGVRRLHEVDPKR